MQISTYIEQSVDHELSGNIIDLCPVGALNNKPYRYRARAWEMTQHPLVSPHDCVGTNLYGHVLRGRLMRVVPRANEEINETWIADRDRFSYEGLYTDGSRAKPMQSRIDGEWREVDWETALGMPRRPCARSCATARRRADRLPGLADRDARGARAHGAARARTRCAERRPPAAPRRFPRPGLTSPAAPLLGCRIAELETARRCWSSAATCARTCR